MANRCDICGKGPLTGHAVSHSHRKTKRQFRPNLRPVRALVGGRARNLRVCAKCLKAGKVARAA